MKNLLIAILVLGVSTATFAAGKNGKKKTVTTTTVVEEVEVEDGASTPVERPIEKSPKIIKKTEDYIVEDSSRFNRADKKYATWIQLFGIGPSIADTAGLAFGYYHTSNDIFFLEATRGDDIWDGFDDVDLVAKSVGVHWKHFTGNSFYLNTGIDFRSVNYDQVDGFTATVSHFKATSSIISFAIGNQWQWDNFTLGCDWIGVSAPITHDVSEARINSVSPSEVSEFKDDQKTFSENVHGQLLRFYLGASF